MSRNQSRATKWMWEHLGIALRKRGVGDQFHVEARGVAAYLLVLTWLAGMIGWFI
jgi:hypothetical protein